MSLFKCKFCNNNFKTNILLTRHQTTVKYCLKIQKEKEDESKFTCIDCDKEFTTKQTLVSHVNICKRKFQNIIIDLENKIIEKDDLLNTKNDIIKELKIKLEIFEKDHEFIKEIAKQPKTQNNTINNNNSKVMMLSPFTMTQNDINTLVNNNFTKEHFLDGQKGVADFTSTNLLKDDEGKTTYICTDSSRNVFNYKNKDGQVEKDIKAIKLTKTLSPAVITKSEKIFNQYKTDDTTLEYMQRLSDIKKLNVDNDKFVNQLSILTSNTIGNSLVIENETSNLETIEEVVEEYTQEELQFMENMRVKKEEALNKIRSLKDHENQSLYKFHVRMFIQKYGEIGEI